MAMFKNLSERLSTAFKKISGKASISESNIEETLRDVRVALLEADVALPVVKDFLSHVKERALGHEVRNSLNPGQQFLKIVEAELTSVMGEENHSLEISVQPPAVILMTGMQGSGKTTSSAKLAHYLKERHRKKVMMVSVDRNRAAAIKQLEILASEVGVDFFPTNTIDKPTETIELAIAAAKKNLADVLIIDTAGRLHIDHEMMSELNSIYDTAKPTETLFVIDSMVGQDALNIAKSFNERIDLTGIILTKLDGDTRGGAALSVRQITGKPIKFIGVGEKIDSLEPFHPERLVSRILGMGDMLSLIEDIERKIDKEKAQKLAGKVARGSGFDLDDLREQIQQMQKMGGVGGLIDKIPGMNNINQMASDSNVSREFSRMEVIIDSMTRQERRNPEILNGSRKRRITAGSGTTIQDLNRLIKQHKQMSKMMKKMKGKGMQNMMRGLTGGSGFKNPYSSGVTRKF